GLGAVYGVRQRMDSAAHRDRQWAIDHVERTMPVVEEPVRCPQLVSDRWIGGGPVAIGAGTPVLVDFWDYTCVNCLNTLPYLKAWYERYRPLGLEIVGVHAPEFPFAKDAGLVERAVHDLGITWPVAIDNDYKIWQSYANRYWPA